MPAATSLLTRRDDSTVEWDCVKMSCPCIGSGTPDSTVVRSAGTGFDCRCCSSQWMPRRSTITLPLLGTCLLIILLWLSQAPRITLWGEGFELRGCAAAEGATESVEREAKLWVSTANPRRLYCFGRSTLLTNPTAQRPGARLLLP